MKRPSPLGPLGMALASWLLFWPGATAAADAPPQIQPAVTFQHRAVFLGQTNTFTVMATGPALSYQWRLDGQDLPGETNQTLVLTNTQPADEGDYTVQVSNTDGAVISDAARLWVVPPSTNLVPGNFTNDAGLRLPYFITVPTNYDPARNYPLVLIFHGAGVTATFDENLFPGFASQYPWMLVEASYHQQATDPVVLVWPSRRAGDNSWTDSYLRLVSGLLDKLTAEFSIDTDRVYVGGGSEGVHAAWDLIAQRPGYFAGAFVCAGYPGSAPPASIKDVPVWGWHSLQDEYGGVATMRALIHSLRMAGGSAIYTEYLRGNHMESIGMGMVTPAIVDWMLSQRREVASTAEPLLAITSPTAEPTYASAVATLDLAGSAAALGQPITRVEWNNTATHGTGVVSGTNLWSVTGIPLLPPATNLLLVTATTTSGSAGYGGNTTFNDTLAVSWQFDRPVITAHPTNRTVRAGTPAQLTVVAYSPLPMSYQWQFNGSDLPGATNAALTLTNVQAIHAGTYAVVVADASGSVTSAPAVLTVVFEPVIVQQPCSQSAVQGGSVTLSVAVTNTATLPIGYRWRRGTVNQTNIVLDAHVCFFTVTNLQATTNYGVIVTNAASSKTSSTAWVTILPDGDGDGLPDPWEITCGINQATANHATADDDSDGLTNGQEYTAGTDPTNALSYLKVESIALTEGQSAAVLRFLAVSNKTYTVQYRESADVGLWIRLAEVVATSTNRVVELSDPARGGGAQRFYRLVTPHAP